MNEFHVIGVMSGSSLDGLDICAATFTEKSKKWSFHIDCSETTPIPDELTSQLQLADQLGDDELTALDLTYGVWIGEALTSFINKNDYSTDLIGVHGHTVFHDPVVKKISVQIGNGAIIRDKTGIPVIDNFRTLDIKLGGQGAPLVPVGEHYLFPEYDTCVNLGGICNISIHTSEAIKAWDIAPCNQVLNFLAKQLGHEYDKGGMLAKKGDLHLPWINHLQSLDYFQKAPPKSLSNQWTQKVLQNLPESPYDGLYTYTKFLATQVAQAIESSSMKTRKVLFTGGGTYNETLIKCLEDKMGSKTKLVVPDPQLIDFKEALIFGFLALLRKLNIPNIFCSVTGAQQDSISGDLHETDSDTEKS